MRRIIASAVIAGFVFTTASPILAQRSIKKPRRAPTPVVKTPPSPIGMPSGSFADFESVTAASDANGTLVRWTMRSEAGVAFYRVYRIDAKGGRTQVGEPVLGSAAKSSAPIL